MVSPVRENYFLHYVVFFLLFQRRKQNKTHSGTDNVDTVVLEKLQFQFFLIYHSLCVSW